ncbi:MAG: hypothetical protein ACRDL3_06280 [Solirubrobacterales bacterium]
MGAGAPGAAWEIVDIGQNTWEVVVIDASAAEETAEERASAARRRALGGLHS